MMFFWTKKRKYWLFLVVGIAVLGGASGVIAFFATKNQNKKPQIREMIKTNNNPTINSPDIYKNNFYRPFQFEELKEIGKDQQIMYGGIGYDAYMFGASFLLNIAWKLGLNLFEDEGQLTKEGNVKNVDYYNNFNQAEIEKNTPNENPQEILKTFKKIEKETLTKKTKKRTNLNWPWNFAEIDPFGIDGSLSYGFLNNGGWNHEGIFKSTENGIFEFKAPYPKQQFGAYSFWQIIDGSGPKPKQKTFVSGEKTKEEGNAIITGLHISNSHLLKGSFITRFITNKSIIRKDEKWSFNYHFRSIENYRQRYVIVSQKKMDEIKMLYLAIINNVKSYLDKNKKVKIANNLHPIVARFFQLLRNLDINDKKVVAKIKQAIDELNNGSHNLLSVEIFARGIQNVPMRYMPIPSSGVMTILKIENPKLKYPKKGVGDIEGLASTSNINNALLKMIHSAKKDYFDQNGEASTTDREMFDPRSMKTIRYGSHNWKNHRNIWGKEVKLMGGLVQKKIYNKWWNDYQLWLKDKSLKKPILKYVDENL